MIGFARGRPGHSAGVPVFHCEADVVAGLESLAQDELSRCAGRITLVRPSIFQFTCADALGDLLRLRTVLSVYLLQRFDVPRPRALLGEQNLRAVFDQIDRVLGLLPKGAYRTFMLGAAGSDSAVMARLKDAIAEHTGLSEVEVEGDLLIRIRPTANSQSPAQAGSHRSEARSRLKHGWDVLVRLSPRPLATRDWRVCNTPGSLQATVAHAMVMLTRPKPGDVYLNLCCGSGTLLIERALAGPAAQLIGCDANRDVLICASRNIAAYRRLVSAHAAEIKLHDWDATQLPLPDASVDALTADLPFGHRTGSHVDNTTLYPALMREAARVAKPGARFALITAEVRLMEHVLQQSPTLWARERSLRVNLGGLQPIIHVLRKM